MRKRKDIITVAIDSPAAAGAGSQAKLIAKHYNLQHLDTGRIYRLVGKLKLRKCAGGGCIGNVNVPLGNILVEFTYGKLDVVS